MLKCPLKLRWKMQYSGSQTRHLIFFDSCQEFDVRTMRASMYFLKKDG